LEATNPQNLERRIFPRIEDNIFIFITLSSPSTHLSTTSTRRIKTFTKNIGAGGLMFETEESIDEKGEGLEIEIYQPLNPDKTLIYCIPTFTKVIWTEKIAKDHFENGENKFKVGIAFLKIREQDRQKIVKYINKITAEKRTSIK
jgi:c-di-GMP-binding flagellar brake protein YcgR